MWGTASAVGPKARRFPMKRTGREPLAHPRVARVSPSMRRGTLYVSTNGDSTHVVVRFDKTPTGYSAAKTWATGFQAPGDVEVSADGTVY